MNDKLEVLLKKINLPAEQYTFFDGGKLDKIVGTANKKRYSFYLTLSHTLPINLEFNRLLKEAFSDVVEVDYNITLINDDYEIVGDYYKHILESIAGNLPSLMMLLNRNISVNNHTLIIELGNKTEKKKLEEVKSTIIDYLKKEGFKDIELEIVVNEALDGSLKEEIASSLVVDVPKELLEKKEVVSDTKTTRKFEMVRKPLIVITDNPDVVMGNVIDTQASRIDTIINQVNNITIECRIFGLDILETKTDLKIITLKLTDGTDSIYGKIFVNDAEEFKIISACLKVGNWYLMRGNVKDDAYAKELTFSVKDVNVLHKEIVSVKDDAPLKRVELHTHTMMSQMDSVTNVELDKHYVDIVNQARKWGHPAIALTDHNGIQSFPAAYEMVKDINKKLKEGEDPFKVLYGAELLMIDDKVDVVIRPNNEPLIGSTYVVFDFETTGFNAGGGDSIIEIGAVKIMGGDIIEKYDELINPGRPLPAKIVEVTSITDDMLQDKDNEENAIKRFVAWFGDLPMVAHNAKFDVSFLEMAYKKYNLGIFTNTVIDTLELSRTLDTGFNRHSLSALVKRYNIPFDEESHHRGDYDAEATALVFYKMSSKLKDRNFETINDLTKLVSKDEIYKFGNGYHINILSKNKKGLKNLFQIISLSNTKYIYKVPRILRSEIDNYREGLLIGSGCYESEVFTQARSKSDEELSNIIEFYDYVEVQPPECYEHLVGGDFSNQAELLEHIRKIIRVTEETGKIIVATGDVHNMRPEDKIYREIIANQKVPGGGRHPLSKYGKVPNQYFRTTREMLEAFEFLPVDKALEIVVTNTKKIADMCEIIEVIIETGGVPFSPKIEKSVETVTELVYNKAADWYGTPLPYNIEERIAKELYGDGIYSSIKEELEGKNISGDKFLAESFKCLHEVILQGFDAVKEKIRENIRIKEPELSIDDVEGKMKKSLGGIIGGGFDVIYLIAQKLVKKSNDDGYLVGSRGSVGSSFVATMMGITEVNPLPPHYRCLKCKHSIFDSNNIPLANTYSSGFDLPDLDCPKCGAKMFKDGNDMPFATFLGFNADKVPDIDLNFSDLNQAAAHDYTKVLFGVDNVYRAGTIGTVADKTAFGFVKGYCEDKNIVMRNAEIERLAIGCTGVKRTTGQHPGGIVVIPDYMDVYDFTPFQYPADDATSPWRTTHFDYHAIDQDVLKLDILGHSDPTQLRLIQDLSGDTVTDVPMDDKETMGIFLSPKPLGVTGEQILNSTGTLGIPEFGTPFTIQLVMDTKPTSFAELIKISGLSHGTDVWLGNAKELIDNKVIPFKDVIGCRDDIMVYLMQKGMKPIKAFKIMEFVRKGKASKDVETWTGFAEEMKVAGIEDWFIESCRKIKYMFPKAHATAYVMSAFRIAWYKVHKPEYFYASWFSTKATDFDIEVMIKGYDAIKARMEEIINKGYEATNKENGTLECLRLALEMTARGLKCSNVDLNKSDDMYFKVDDDHKTLIPPFRAIDGLGDTVAKNIVEERQKREFMSIEDLQKRAKISSTLLDKMRLMGIFEGMDESNQLSLF